MKTQIKFALNRLSNLAKMNTEIEWDTMNTGAKSHVLNAYEQIISEVHQEIKEIRKKEQNN